MNAAPRVQFSPKSGNAKTGPIPVSTTSAETCPDACPLKGAGCYAEQWHMGAHWRKLTLGLKPSLSWAEFCARVAQLPPGQLWRHNQAGDLPGLNDAIDGEALAELTRANASAGASGFTYTHKPVGLDSVETIANARAVERANKAGFTVNLSADSLTEVDQLASLGVGPVVVVLPSDAPDKGIRTPQGRHVVVCPAQLRDEITCASCGLCAVATRKSVVGFKAHGAQRRRVSLAVVREAS